MCKYRGGFYGVGNVIDLFCGAGGFSEGFKKAGFDILLGIDFDKNALDTFKYNHNAAVTICEDIRNINIEKKEEKIIIKSSVNLYDFYEFDKPIDVILGGIPCNSFSTQSNGKNKEGSRSRYCDLYKEYIRFIKELRPKVFIIENVPRFLKDTDNNEKCIYEEIERELGPLDYYIKGTIKNIANYGVPQKRERSIIIGSNIKEIEFPTEIIKENQWITVRDAILDLPKETYNHKGCKKLKLDECSMNYNNLSEYQISMRKREYLFNHITCNNGDVVKQRIEKIPQGGNWEDISYRLLDKTHTKIKMHNNKYNRLELDKPAKTITHIGKNYTIHPIYNRLLSVREGARIQGFMDEYIFKGGISSQYQQVANAVSPIFSKCIAEKIKEYI